MKIISRLGWIHGFIALLLCAVSLCYSQTGEYDACDFDDKVIDAFIANEKAPSNYRTVLDLFLKEGSSVKHSVCADSARYEALSQKVSKLFNRSKTDKHLPEYDVAYTKYAYFVSPEDSAYTYEDNAFYNFALDLMIAKYDRHFAHVKNTMFLAGVKSNYKRYGFETEWDAALDEFLVTRLAAKNGISSEVMSTELAKVVPFYWGLYPKYSSSQYQWLQAFLRGYETVYYRSEYSTYATILDLIINDALMEELTKNQEDYEIESRKDDDIVFVFGVGVMVGKSLLSSVFDPVGEKVSVSVPHARFRFGRVVLQLQGDMYIDHSLSAMGLEGILGYAFDFGTFEVDPLVGFGFDQFFMGEDTTSSKIGLLGVQALKRIHLHTNAALVPKVQWSVKAMKFDSPLNSRRRWGVVNQFYAGISLEFMIWDHDVEAGL